ncbi:MAG: DUF2807 domain-containing protein, partial [Prevotella sp.]|nr:DUF2807 domain-containing protein [Prevotella sp.]
TVNGKAGNVSAAASGGADINIRNLKSDNVSTSKSGGGDISK